MESGDIIGKYRLVRPLGRGGMGEVWLATAKGHGGFEKNVVLKTLLPQLSRQQLFVDMLANEARIGAKLSHPNLIEVFDFIAHEGIYLLAMEYVVGRPLHQVLQAAKSRGRQLPIELTLRVALDCCRGLEYAHDQGIIHCDLSPSNVIIASAGICKILDFGVAHASAHGPKSDRLKGKFSYMAPERIESLATDRRTDVYALGVLMYLMLTGRLPFTAGNDAELLHKIVTTSPVRPSVFREIDSRVEDLVLRAMQPDPAARHQSCKDMLTMLLPLTEQLGALSHEQMVTYLDTLFAGRPGTEDEITREASEDEVDSFDIEIESDLELPCEEPMPAIRALPAAVFAGGSETREAHTSVQSLFDRPSVALPRIFEPASAIWEQEKGEREAPLSWLSRSRPDSEPPPLFAAHSRADSEPPHGFAAHARADSEPPPGSGSHAPAASEPPPSWLERPRAAGEAPLSWLSRARDKRPTPDPHAPSPFDGYTRTQRPDEPQASWPWPTSRVKP